MRISIEKIAEVIAALDAAEKALLELDSEDTQNGVIAGQCAIAKVYLTVERDAQTLKVFHITGAA